MLTTTVSVVSSTPVVSESAVIVSSSPVVSESTVIVPSPSIVSSTTVVAFSSLTAPTAWSWCFATIADMPEGEVGVFAFGASPIVIVEGPALLSVSSPVVSSAPVVSESTVVVSPSTVVSTTMFPAAPVSAVASTAPFSAFTPMFLGLLFGTNGYPYTDECVHVKRPVNVGYMG